MTINLADLKWRQSQRLTDNDDGGGRMTGTEVVDGQVNNLLPDISRIDRTAGKVNLRKAFAHVATGNTDVLAGAHAAIMRPPTDPNVSLVMFETESFTDERAAAQNFVESYVIEGPISPYRLYDTQQTGQRSLLMWAATTQPSPEVGEVYVLSIEATGWTPHKQFVRVTKVEYVDTQFDYGDSKKTWRIYTVSINQPLDQSYPGEDPQATQNPQLSNARTKIRRTQVADVANYYGITTLAEAAVPGDVYLQLDSVYGQLVPASTEESPALNRLPNGVKAVQVAAGPPITLTIATGSQSAEVKPIYLGGSVLPGSLTVSSATEGLSYVDEAGALLNADNSAARCNGSPVDYTAAVINLNADAYGGNYTITWTPAATVLQSPYTSLYAIDLETQRYVYTFNLRPYPSAGSVTISYRALGKWYVINDDGAGHLVPVIANTGSGLIDYQTGNFSVTLGALPDVDSALIVTWGEQEIYSDLAGEITVDLPVITVQSATGAIDPGTVEITWTNGAAKTATDNGSGTITGDADGRVDYGAGVIKFRPAALPAAGTVYTVEMASGTSHTGSATGSLAGTTLSGTFGPAPLRPGTIHMVIPRVITESLSAGQYFPGPVPSVPDLVVTDDGAGNLVAGGSNVGTVNYTTGDWSVDTAGELTVRVAGVQAAP